MSAPIGNNRKQRNGEPARLSVCTVTLVRADNKKSMIKTR